MFDKESMECPSTAVDITNLINFDIASATVKIGSDTIESVLTMPKASLTRWLYSKLHAGEGASPQRMELHRADLENEICEGLLDETIKVPWIGWPGYEKNYCAIGNVRVCISPDTDDFIEIPRIRRNLTPGFVFYFASIGDTQSISSKKSDGIRIYIASDDKEYSLSVWRELIKSIKDNNLCVSLKILSDSASFPRSDSIVVYATENYDLVLDKVVEVVKNNEKSILMEKYNSYLTKKIWANVAVADQPRASMQRKMSFGQDRCDTIAEAIKDYLLTGTNFLELLRFRLTSNGINPDDLSQSI